MYKFHTNILIVVFLIIGFMAVKVNDKAFSMMTLGAVVCFVTQLSLLIYFSREKEVIYSTKTLFWVVLFYNICMIPIATGLLPISISPMMASLAMTLSSLTVVINSLRISH